MCGRHCTVGAVRFVPADRSLWPQRGTSGIVKKHGFHHDIVFALTFNVRHLDCCASMAKTPLGSVGLWCKELMCKCNARNPRPVRLSWPRVILAGRLVLPPVTILRGWTARENHRWVCRNRAIIGRQRCLFLWSKEVELRHTGRTRLTSIGRWFVSLHNKGIADLNSEWTFTSGETRQSPVKTGHQLLFILARKQSLLHRSVTTLRSTDRVHSFYFVSCEVKNLFGVVCLWHCLEEGCGQDVFALPVGT